VDTAASVLDVPFLRMLEEELRQLEWPRESSMKEAHHRMDEVSKVDEDLERR
jgi:hypothetical protein